MVGILWEIGHRFLARLYPGTSDERFRFRESSQPNDDRSRCDESYQAAQQTFPLTTTHEMEANHNDRRSHDHAAEKPQPRLLCIDPVSNRPPQTTEKDRTQH
jgi:hypothetical protein